VGRRATALEHGELWRRVCVTLGALAIYRLGAHIPLPGVDLQVLQEIFDRNAGRGLDMFTGGAAGRMSLFALGIMPYISASITLLLLTVAWQALRRRQVDDYGLDRYARIGAVGLAATQALAIAVGLERAGPLLGGRSLVSDPGPLFELSTVTALTAGTLLTMWLADEITRRGIGNGIGLIFFSSIVGRLPSALTGLLEHGRSGVRSPAAIVLFLVLVIATIAFIVFMESAERRIRVQYRPRLVGTTMFEGEGSYLSLRPNGFGIIPALFASTLLLFPATIAGYGTGRSGWAGAIATYFRHGQPAYLAYYAGLIVLFAFLYVALLLSPKIMAEALIGYGGTVDGHAPGAATARYLAYIRNRLTLIGALYVAGICLLPEILVSQYNAPFYFGGSRLLIAVCVALDLVRQIRAHLDRPG
jgi:preprotein translocase subunit SecY